MTDDSAQGRGRGWFESTPPLVAWWTEVHLQRTGTTARCAICVITTGLVLLQKGGGGQVVSWRELVPLCAQCADQVTSILATRCRPGGRWAGMPRDLAVESAVLHVLRHGQQD